MTVRRCFNRLMSLARREEGVAYMEFALCVSVLLILFIGSVEVTRYVLIIQKLEKVASTVADVTTQANPNTSPLTTTVMSELMSAVQDMMNPYTFGANGLVIVTDVTQAGANNPIVNWQYCGGGTLSATSKIGTTIGGAATLPSGFTMIAGEETVFSEVFYKYTPIFTAQSFTVATTLYRTAVYMPRLGVLTGFSSHC
jgi:Flp pilus assembly protein TadG